MKGAADNLGHGHHADDRIVLAPADEEPGAVALARALQVLIGRMRVRGRLNPWPVQPATASDGSQELGAICARWPAEVDEVALLDRGTCHDCRTVETNDAFVEAV